MKKQHSQPRRSPIYLHAIGTAVPANRLAQSEILEFMQRLQADSPEKSAFMQKIYEGSAIETRYSVLGDYRRQWPDFDFYPRNPQLEPSPGTAQRNALFVAEADKLGLAASRALFNPANPAGLRLEAGQITHLITVSCTGFSAPGFDLSLQKSLGLSPALQRFHLGFMGCYAAFPALKLAWNLCRADSQARVLIVDVELCTLHFQKDWGSDAVVANALFADGAAAAVVSAQAADSRRPRFALRDFATRMIAESGDEMAWVIGDTGFDMKLSAYVPRVIDANLPPILDELLARNQLGRHAVGHWAIHPGGRAILDKLARSLSLADTALDHSYEILRNFGNMSSATIFFVLDLLAGRHSAALAGAAAAVGATTVGTAGAVGTASVGAIGAGAPAEGAAAIAGPGPLPSTVFAAAFGPGLTVESALFEVLPANPVKPAPWWPDLRTRSREPELMDDPAIDRRLLKRTIGQFGLLNRLFSAYRPILKREFFGRMTDPSRVYTLLDIGAGGGDIPLWLIAEARRRGLKLKITCIDQDERVIPWAQQAVAHCPEIEVVHARAEGLAGLGQFDFMFCNHLLHHLGEPAIVSLFQAAQRQCRINFVFNDLKRSLGAYWGYTIFTALFVRRSLAYHDGRLSIRRGFRWGELAGLLAKAGLSDELEIGTAHPARLYISRRIKP